MTLVWTLIVLFINSFVLYVVPEGRVSYWADWSFLGLTKKDWGAQHTTIGVLFLIAGLFHIYYNWKPIINYMKNKAKDFKFFSVANTAALILTLIFVVGTYFHVPPMSTIMNISEGFKDRAADKFGEPPYGHAETSPIKTFTQRVGLELDKSIELLKAAGIAVKDEQDTLKDIGKRAGKSPQEVYMIIKPASKSLNSIDDTSENKGTENTTQDTTDTDVDAFINAERTGLGRLTIEDICQTYGLDCNTMITRLASKGIKTSENQKLKEIGEVNDITPLAIYEIMVEIVSKK